jgi:hypothetical protein
MRVGQFVRAKVAGNTYNNVFVIPRRAVTQDFMISIAQEGQLQKRQITPLWTDSEAVVIAAEQTYIADAIDNDNSIDSPLTTQDVLILTPTANFPNGTRVRSLNEQVPGERGQRPSPIVADKQAQQVPAANSSQSNSVNSAES